MMKLYYKKGACSLSVRIALEAARIPFEAVPLPKEEDAQAYGAFLKLNPMGAVPTLVLDDGKALTEAAVILQYVADLKPESNLAPKAGTWERVELQRWLNFTATELHKRYNPFFAPPALTDEPNKEILRKWASGFLNDSYACVDAFLGSRETFMPWGFSIVDAYFFTVTSWAPFVKYDLSPYPNVARYMAEMAKHPTIQKALKDEHLVR